MDLVNRYVYAVTKGFSGKQREEIEKELKSNIEDMLEQYEGSEPYDERVKKVLLELGDPAAIADEYRGSKRYLIGPELYETYMLVLKIVIGTVFGGISIALFIQSFSTMGGQAEKILFNYLSALFSGLLQAFAWTTIAFMIAERKSELLNKNQSDKSKWNPAQLPPVPIKKAVISLSESIFTIIFTTIFYTVFIVLLYSAPEVIAVYIKSGSDIIAVPIFNMEVLQGYKLLFIGIFILSISRELSKLYYRRWMRKLSILHTVMSSISLVLTLVIFTNNSIWNPSFSQDIINYMAPAFDVAALWENFKSWVVAVIILASTIEIISVLYKGIRYDIKNVQ